MTATPQRGDNVTFEGETCEVAHVFPGGDLLLRVPSTRDRGLSARATWHEPTGEWVAAVSDWRDER